MVLKLVEVIGIEPTWNQITLSTLYQSEEIHLEIKFGGG
jgi:hypothetical protein